MKYNSNEWVIENVRVGYNDEFINENITYIETPTVWDHTFKISITSPKIRENHPDSSDAVEKVVHVSYIIITSIARFTVKRRFDLDPVPNEYYGNI